MPFRRSIACLVMIGLVLLPSSVFAESATKGLTISPIRQELTVKPNKTTEGSFTVGNATDHPMTITLSVEQFSVADYSYDYEFRAPPSNDWVKLRQSQIELAPHKSQKVYFDVVVPNGVAPGGYYFSLFAGTTIEGPGLPGTVRAASLLYTKVDGKLIRTSIMENGSIPFLVTGGEVPYKFDVKDTGNVHFSAYFYGQLASIFGELPEVGTSHVLMPGAVRTIEGSVPTPLLPGIYKMSYGYKVDFADIVTIKTGYIVFIPPWSVVALIVLVYVVWRVVKNKRQIAAWIKRKR